MKRIIAALCAAGMLLVGGVARAADGDILVDWQRSGSYSYKIWKGLDAQGDATASGTAIRIGAFDSLTIWPISGIDGGDTWSADCGVSGTITEPTVWFAIQAETSSTSAVRLDPGDACEWIRINKPTDTNDDSTVYVMAVRSSR